MKKIAILAVSLLVVAGSYAQGTVNFANAGAGLNAPIFDENGTTKLAGAGFMVELLAGTTATSLAAVGTPTTFLSGGGAGYFNGGVITVPGIAAGTSGFFAVRAWNDSLGATYALASAAGHGYGTSSPFQVTTGGAGTPAGPPATLVGLTSFSLVAAVPEPSTIALGLLGAAALLLRRRK